MWLIHTTSLQLRSFQGKRPSYAILSHRWGDDDDEISFQQWRDDHAKISHKPGFVKIDKACEQAREDELEYLWADTCCIDKSSSAELSEAINSMFDFYARAKVCYAYLQDVHDSADVNLNLLGIQAVQLPHSDWFTRGWTLQELLAPKNLVFFSSTWSRIGTRDQLSSIVSEVAGIPVEVFQLNEDGEEDTSLFEFSIATRMSWVANRVTTRIEDIAYCMLGILDINMPLLYGEGQRAFQRLQEELIKASDDTTIFVWDWLPRFKRTGRHGPNFPHHRVAHLVDMGWDIEPVYTSEEMNFRRYQGARDISSGATSMFAPDPVFFFVSPRTHYRNFAQGWYDDSTPFFITNKGLSISLPVHDMAFTVTGAGYGGRASLVPLCLNGVEADAGWGLWLQGTALFLTTSKGSRAYTRCRGYDEDGEHPYTMFRGHLLSFSMPSSLFQRYFRLKAMFVNATDGYQSLFAWDHAPEAGVVVLNDAGTRLTIGVSSDGMDPELEGFSLPVTLSGYQPQTRTSIYGAIYLVTRYAEGARRSVEFAFHVLVRAAKRRRSTAAPDEDAKRDSEEEDLFYWRCEVITNSFMAKKPGPDRNLWAMGSTLLTFPEILDLPMEEVDDEPIEDHSVLLRRKIRDNESGKDVAVSICVNLTGECFWVTNPASSIKFLHVTEERLAI